MASLRRLQKEFKLLQEEEKLNSHFNNVTLVNEDIYHWNALLKFDQFGKEVEIEIDIKIPQEYPFKAPTFKTFKTPKRTLPNPSVLENGVFCIDSAFNDYSPLKTITMLLEDVMKSYDCEFFEFATNIHHNTNEYSFSHLRNINWEKIDVNQRLENQQHGYDSILDLAIMKKNIETVKYLVEEVKADVTLVQTFSGNSLLHLAATYSPVIFKYLLEKTEIDLFLKNRWNKTAIEVAVDNARFNIIKYLFSNHLIDINRRYDGGNTLLMVAFYAQQRLDTDYKRIINYLINGADIHAMNDEGNSIFHLATVVNYTLLNELSSLRLEEGKCYKNTEGKTPYMLALPLIPHFPLHTLSLLRQNNEISANCSVCDEDQKLFVLENCGHSFCSNCLTESLSVNNSLFNPCLHRDCQVDISVSDLQILHPNFDVHSKKLTYKCLNERSNFHWCPRCENGGFFSENINCNVIECDCCNTSFCLCGEVVGPSQKSKNSHIHFCKEIKSFKTIKTIAKECPSCSVFIEHYGGCSHITCICKYQFCFVCLGPYVGKTVSNINEPCTCRSD